MISGLWNYSTLEPLPFDFTQAWKLFLWYPLTLQLPYRLLGAHILAYIRNTWTATEGWRSTQAEAFVQNPLVSRNCETQSTCWVALRLDL